MPAERAPMRKVREILRLGHTLGVSERQIALTTGLSRSTVGEYLRRAAVIGITWPVPEGVDDAELERRLFTPPTFDEKPARPGPPIRYARRRSVANYPRRRGRWARLYDHSATQGNLCRSGRQPEPRIHKALRNFRTLEDFPYRKNLHPRSLSRAKRPVVSA